MVTTIGIDPHKATHTAVAIDQSESVLGEITLPADRYQTKTLLNWAQNLDGDGLVWAVEAAADQCTDQGGNPKGDEDPSAKTVSVRSDPFVLRFVDGSWTRVSEPPPETLGYVPVDSNRLGCGRLHLQTRVATCYSRGDSPSLIGMNGVGLEA